MLKTTIKGLNVTLEVKVTANIGSLTYDETNNRKGHHYVNNVNLADSSLEASASVNAGAEVYEGELSGVISQLADVAKETIKSKINNQINNNNGIRLRDR